MRPARTIDALTDIMARLRTPVTGCAWDLAQSFESIAPYTIEEAYEVADAIQRGDLLDLRDELGDLLLQVVFHARIAQERGAFDFGDVVEAICDKLVRRHPHIFGETKDLSPDEVKALWDTIKAEERAVRAAERGDIAWPSARVLDKVPAGLPPLSRAQRLQARAAEVGFDWPDLAPVVTKVREETDEVEEVVRSSDSKMLAREGEIGDLLFAVVNLARHAGVDAEKAMNAANAKFIRRFGAVEMALSLEGKTLAQSNLAEMDAHWDAAKRAERG